MSLQEYLKAPQTLFDQRPSDEQQLLRQKIKQWIQFRHKKLSSEELTKIKSECLDSKIKNTAICSLFLDVSTKEFFSEDEATDEDRPEDLITDKTGEAQAEMMDVSTLDFVQWVRQVEIEKLLKVKSRFFYSGFKRISNLKELTLLSEQLLAQSSENLCKNTSLTVALAQKLETFLPDLKLKELALKLYEAILVCKPQSVEDKDSIDRAKYRRALWFWVDKDYNEADGVFKQIEPNPDYTVRAYYWRSQIAQLMGDKLGYQRLSQRLLKEYPLSYHTVLTRRKDLPRVFQVLLPVDNQILLSSLKNPKLNSWIEVVEVLLQETEFSLAQNILNRVYSEVLKSEPEFRIYISLLSEKALDPILQYKLLSSVFKSDPRFLNQETLKLFFPLKKKQSIDTYSKIIDPLFIASLIRQESGFNSKAVSRVGARGLMQLMPATARQLAGFKIPKTKLFEPDLNIKLGVRLMNQLTREYSGDVELALGAYNAGKDRVDDWLVRYGLKDRLWMMDLIPFKETRDYIALIGRNYFWYSMLYQDPVKSNVPVSSETKSVRVVKNLMGLRLRAPMVMSLFK